MSLIETLLGPIENLFNRIFGGTVVGRLVSKIRDGIGHILTLWERIENLVALIQSEVRAFRNWREDFQIKNKVINLPKAVERTVDLVHEVQDAWGAVQALVKDFTEKLKGENPTQEAEEFAADIEGSAGEGILKRLPKLAKGLEKLLGIVTLVVDAIIAWSDAVDRLTQIVQAISDLRQEIETGSTIFLFQGNQRRTVKLADGTSMKIRVGKLHS